MQGPLVTQIHTRSKPNVPWRTQCTLHRAHFVCMGQNMPREPGFWWTRMVWLEDTNPPGWYREKLYTSMITERFGPRRWHTIDRISSLVKLFKTITVREDGWPERLIDWIRLRTSSGRADENGDWECGGFSEFERCITPDEIVRVWEPSRSRKQASLNSLGRLELDLNSPEEKRINVGPPDWGAKNARSQIQDLGYKYRRSGCFDLLKGSGDVTDELSTKFYISVREGIPKGDALSDSVDNGFVNYLY